MQPKICTEWLHTLTWLNDVWSGVTPSTSPIPRFALYLPAARTQNTHRFPFPELCFENRSFLLTVNSQADRYGLTILSVTKPLCGYLHSTHVTAASVSPRWSITNHHRHTHEECRITLVGRIPWCDVQLILLCWVAEEAFMSLSGVKLAIPQWNNTLCFCTMGGKYMLHHFKASQTIKTTHKLRLPTAVDHSYTLY